MTPEELLVAREAALEALRDGEKFLLATHENPDGDALGSLLGMSGALRALGKDVLVYVAEGELPLPEEYRFLPLEHHVSDAPEDLDSRTVVFLDCGNIDRNPADALKQPGRTIVNIDHHHDNTNFGTVNHVVPSASCTAEIVCDLMEGLDVAMTREIAEALYVGLVTDTGKFMYENTGPGAHLMAAKLIEAGIDVHEIYRRLYEGVPFEKLELLGRGLTNVQRYEGGALTLTRLARKDFEETGAEEGYSEGVVDHLRSVDGTAVAGLVRDLMTGPTANAKKVSLRASDDRVDVSKIAREQGGGGHRRAAGFSTTLPWEDLVAFLRREVAAQL